MPAFNYFEFSINLEVTILYSEVLEHGFIQKILSGLPSFALNVG